jgi:hypothetical protein
VQAPDIDAPKTLSSATIVNSDSAKTLLKSKLSIKLATSTVFYFSVQDELDKVNR